MLLVRFFIAIEEFVLHFLPELRVDRRGAGSLPELRDDRRGAGSLPELRVDRGGAGSQPERP